MTQREAAFAASPWEAELLRLLLEDAQQEQGRDSTADEQYNENELHDPESMENMLNYLTGIHGEDPLAAMLQNNPPSNVEDTSLPSTSSAEDDVQTAFPRSQPFEPIESGGRQLSSATIQRVQGVEELHERNGRTTIGSGVEEASSEGPFKSAPLPHALMVKLGLVEADFIQSCSPKPDVTKEKPLPVLSPLDSSAAHSSHLIGPNSGSTYAAGQARDPPTSRQGKQMEHRYMPGGDTLTTEHTRATSQALQYLPRPFSNTYPRVATGKLSDAPAKQKSSLESALAAAVEAKPSQWEVLSGQAQEIQMLLRKGSRPEGLLVEGALVSALEKRTTPDALARLSQGSAMLASSLGASSSGGSSQGGAVQGRLEAELAGALKKLKGQSELATTAEGRREERGERGSLARELGGLVQKLKSGPPMLPVRSILTGKAGDSRALVADAAATSSAKEPSYQRPREWNSAAAAPFSESRGSRNNGKEPRSGLEHQLASLVRKVGGRMGAQPPLKRGRKDHADVDRQRQRLVGKGTRGAGGMPGVVAGGATAEAGSRHPSAPAAPWSTSPLATVDDSPEAQGRGHSPSKSSIQDGTCVPTQHRELPGQHRTEHLLHDLAEVGRQWTDEGDGLIDEELGILTQSAFQLQMPAPVVMCYGGSQQEHYRHPSPQEGPSAISVGPSSLLLPGGIKQQQQQQHSRHPSPQEGPTVTSVGPSSVLLPGGITRLDSSLLLDGAAESAFHAQHFGGEGQAAEVGLVSAGRIAKARMQAVAAALEASLMGGAAAAGREETTATAMNAVKEEDAFVLHRSPCVGESRPLVRERPNALAVDPRADQFPIALWASGQRPGGKRAARAEPASDALNEDIRSATSSLLRQESGTAESQLQLVPRSTSHLLSASSTVQPNARSVALRNPSKRIGLLAGLGNLGGGVQGGGSEEWPRGIMPLARVQAPTGPRVQHRVSEGGAPCCELVRAVTQPMILKELSPDLGFLPPQPSNQLLRAVVRSKLLLLAKAFARNEQVKVLSLKQELTELADPKGCFNRRLACYVLNALNQRSKGVALPFISHINMAKDVNPRTVVEHFTRVGWLPFSVVAQTYSFVHALRGCSKVHVILFAEGNCVCWATFFRELACQPGGAPLVKITSVRLYRGDNPVPDTQNAPDLVMQAEARRNGVTVVHSVIRVPPVHFNPGLVDIEADEALAVGSCWHLALFPDKRVVKFNPRTAILKWVHSLTPKIVVMIESNADFNGGSFFDRFEELLDRRAILFEKWDAVTPQNSPGRAAMEFFTMQLITEGIAYEGLERFIRDERTEQWADRMNAVGFGACGFPAESWDAWAVFCKSNENFRVQRSGDVCTLQLLGVPCLHASAWVPVH